ncbi:ABC transporter ATP-binding protein [Paenibacillus radicis (ex Xue et al. 2023)]|uniref:ABC transporter ATP-binding protein n=1 Tax=Paenibacillus radicis (ex Xue et al. 2023) TaxID=2972489 RepID=A0ABT1YND1_9BACL|nr:ABC transporter ATP-binding protein [Paenibacillus radicis (ex Xue et al. 2023)]MCR8634682.1 ABC transporter ATP-binding protein [Paenibacillus radicis (ex Xue et al. 2023)]
MTLLDIQHLTVDFATKHGLLTAITDVSLSIKAGETVCLVGESGSGKTVASKSIMRLIDYENGVISKGSILLEGVDLAALSQEQLRVLRGKKIAMIFQEPMAAFDPVFTIGSQIVDNIIQHKRVSKQAAAQQSIQLLYRVGIPEPELRMRQYPNELSGGMLQRAMIAMALSCEPELLIADEPTTALDVTIQAQILQLLQELKAEYNMSILLITHDMGIAAQLADRIVVMYAGRVMEQAAAIELFQQPYHPYTKALLQSILTLEGNRDKRLYSIEGSIPSLTELPEGCRFHPRCSYATDKCVRFNPPLQEINGREVACWHAEELVETQWGAQQRNLSFPAAQAILTDEIQWILL